VGLICECIPIVMEGENIRSDRNHGDPRGGGNLCCCLAAACSFAPLLFRTPPVTFDVVDHNSAPDRGGVLTPHMPKVPLQRSY
jgi:hypothetical protein